MSDPRTIAQYEAKAAIVLPKYAWDYYKTGSEEEKTLKRNLEIWKSINIIPRCLVNVAQRNQHVSLMNGRFTVTSPICVAPTGNHAFAHPEGEKAVARACSELNMLYIASGISSFPMESIAQSAPGALKWQNVYILKQRKKLLELLKRAERSGYGAIVVSLDMSALSRRVHGPSLDDHGPYVYHNIADKVATWAGNFDPSDTLHICSDPSATWTDLKWVIDNTQLPVVAKGIMNPTDALRAVEIGVSAIIVSNHGARQLDSVPATIEILPLVVDAVAGKVDVYLDGGIRCGTDVFKALALGAKAVFIGRPILFGLAANGKDGVKHVLTILRHELDIAMALTGCRSLDDIQKESLVHDYKIFPARL